MLKERAQVLRKRGGSTQEKGHLLAGREQGGFFARFVRFDGDQREEN